jgi:hypothetical protein
MSEDEGKNLQAVISIAQTLLLKEKDKSAITPALIAAKVDSAAELVAGENAVDRAAAIGELIRRFSLWIGQDTTLINDEGHVHWLVSSRKKDWRYWQRYQGWLELKMSTTAVEAQGKSL